jgi:hypothetical protein
LFLEWCGLQLCLFRLNPTCMFLFAIVAKVGIIGPVMVKNLIRQRSVVYAVACVIYSRRSRTK